MQRITKLPFQKSLADTRKYIQKNASTVSFGMISVTNGHIFIFDENLFVFYIETIYIVGIAYNACESFVYILYAYVVML